MDQPLHAFATKKSKGRRDKQNFDSLDDSTSPLIGRYPYAVIESLKYSRDQRVRPAAVRLSDGHASKLVLLESNLINNNYSVIVLMFVFCFLMIATVCCWQNIILYILDTSTMLFFTNN